MKRRSQTSNNLLELVKVFELDPIYPSDDGGWESYNFRIEILQESKPGSLLHARVWRRETFRISPTFPTPRTEKQMNEPSDEEILVADVFQKWETLTGKTPEQVLEKVLKRIRKTFGLARENKGRRRRTSPHRCYGGSGKEINQ